MEKFVYLMVGVPGSGKSTWCKNDLARNKELCDELGEPCDSVIISRDEIRFSLLKDNDEYFSKEKEVFNTFVNKINYAISNSKTNYIYVDATHISPASRYKVLNRLKLGDDVKVVAVNFLIPEEVVRERNGLRTGRSRVPDTVISNMLNGFTPASTEEKYIDSILEVRYNEQNIFNIGYSLDA